MKKNKKELDAAWNKLIKYAGKVGPRKITSRAQFKRIGRTMKKHIENVLEQINKEKSNGQ